MKRIRLVLAVALIMVAMAVVMAAPALAGVKGGTHSGGNGDGLGAGDGRGFDNPSRDNANPNGGDYFVKNPHACQICSV